MEYCSINEAWGQNKITKQYNKYQNSDKSVEHFEPIDHTTDSYSDIHHTPTERLTYQKDLKKKIKNTLNILQKVIFLTQLILCLQLYQKNALNLSHIKKCKKCQRKLRNQFRPRLVEKLEFLFEDYREVIVLILLGISFMVFINLVQNVISNNNN